jgi:hypothetical protein
VPARSVWNEAGYGPAFAYAGFAARDGATVVVVALDADELLPFPHAPASSPAITTIEIDRAEIVTRRRRS